MADYYAILTHIGEAKLANALALGEPLQITHMAVGDGEGQGAQGTPLPDPAQTALRSERRRAPINTLSTDPANANVLVAEQVIPEDVGGWWIREMGLFDADGDLIAVCNTPPTYKPQLASGSGRTQVVRMQLIVTDTAAVTMSVDPAVVLATRKYVDDGDALTEGKLKELIVASGQTYNKTDPAQALMAVKRIAGAHVRTITTSATLTLADAGLVLVDASASDIVLTLPAASALPALRYRLIRLDASDHTVTVAAAGTDTIEGATNVALSAARPKLILEANGTNAWHDLVPPASQSRPGAVRLATAAEILAGAADKVPDAAGLLSVFLGAGGGGTDDYVKIPFRDHTTGARRELILQWLGVTAGNGTSHLFPIAFPNECLGVAPVQIPSSGSGVEYLQVTGYTASQFQVFAYTDVDGRVTGSLIGARFLAIGY